MLILAGDIGGTNTRLALGEINLTNNYLTIIKEQIFSSKKDSFVAIVKKFLEDYYQPEKACFALAGPVLNNKCTITNLSWSEIDAEKLQVDLNIPQITLINDFVAVGYNIVLDQNKDLLTLQSGEIIDNAPIAIIGAGTGLGKAFAIPQGDSYQVFPTEGGHTNFAPDNQLQTELLQYLAKKGKVDTEAIVSGMGIVNIFKFLKEQKFPNQTAENILTQRDSAQAIAMEAAKENPNFLCQKTMEIFIEAYGAAVGDMAVTFLPFGGIYIAGGIAAQNLPLIQEGKFMKAFKYKARVNPMLLEKIPIYIVRNTLSGLMGAVQYAMNKM
jgi:glucokinase